MLSIIQENQPLTMSSSDLAELIGVERKEANRKIRDMFKDEIAGGIISPTLRANGQVEYYMLPEIESTMFVGKWHTPFLRALSEYWVNRKKSNTPQLPQTFAEALQLAADQAKLIEQQSEKIAIDKPKVEFVDKLVDKSNLMNATTIAQKHGKSAIWLNKILKEHDVYSKAIKRGKVFRQWFIQKKFGEMKQTEMGYSQAMFTNAGEIWINELLIAHGYV
ncbi:antirepressor protein [Vibrio phage 1.087.A._10N.261.45.F9]|nr:antirepressor protein [Vibrio phage 1.087.A._10N.261.45.F9]